MITTLRALPSPSAPLARDLARIAREADRFDRPRAIENAVARFDDAAIRRRDARVTRRLEAVATPCFAFAIGFLIACAV